VFSAIHFRPPGHAGLEVIVEVLDQPFPFAQRILSPDEQQRAARMRSKCARRRFIHARCRLRQLLGERVHEAPSSVALEYEASGRPRLADGGLNFSVSHSGEVAAYAFSPGSRLGIDIEAMRDVPEALAIASAVFGGEERAACRRFGFLYCWTRREALAKALQLPVDRRAMQTPGGWIVESFRPLPGYIAALAVEARKDTP
jgi:4'-phosphopantetheinyl transferase